MPTAFAFDPAHKDLIRDDLEWRVAFGRDFLNFTEDDGKTLNSVAALVTPHPPHRVRFFLFLSIPHLVLTLLLARSDGVYSHLFEYDYTKAFFLKRNVGFSGQQITDLAQLTLDSDQIAFRKHFLRAYVAKIFTVDYEKFATWEYFDKVAKMHTGLKDFKHRANADPLIVDLQPMTLLLGWVEDVVVAAVMDLPNETADAKVKTAVLRAFNKFMWLQNDLFNRWYAKTDEELAAAMEKAKEAGEN
ncbi:hypothetical protein JCM8097_009492 [Rhodosporidiobolus ruineniae]